MLTRSKIKMQESIRQVHHDLPYFNNEEELAQPYYYKQSKNQSKVTQNYSQHSHQHQQVPFKNDYYEYAAETTPKGYGSRNEILKELRQQYEILKNLSIEESMPSYGKKYDQKELYGHSQSSLSSSVHSKKSNKIKESSVTSPKMSNKEVQSLHLEKKQLQIVIGNSMRKIQELLNNEILLKKTIHELKNQLEGKGGVHQQYEKAIRSFQKNEDELQGQLNKSKQQNQKCLLKIKDLNEKIRISQNQLSSKEREIKVGFQEQKKLHQLLRLEKDKYMNLQIQCKSYKMEFDLLEKQKNNQINRLIRQFQSKQGGNEKQMAYIIKKLEQDLKEKDKRYHELLLSKDKINVVQREPEVIEKKNDKNYLEQLLYKSREMNDYNSKALNESVNLIFSKMAEIQKKNEETLKRQIDQLKKKSEDNKRNTNESDLLTRITELEKMIAREVSEKNRLAEDIKNMKSHKYQLQDKNKQLQKKLLSLQERQDELKDEITELQQIKSQYNNTYNDHKSLQGQLSNYTLRIKTLENEIQAHRASINNLNSGFREKEKRYEDEIRLLKRKVDEAQFETEKVRKEAEFNLNVLRSTHELQAKKIVQENGKVSQRLNDSSEQFKSITQQWKLKLQAKESELFIVRSQLQSLRAKGQQDLNGQKIYYDEKITAYENKNNQNIKALNERIVAITSTNDRLMTQIAAYSQMQNELIEMRRILKQTRTMNSSISHLWDIKEVEYGNINQVLNNLKTA